MMYENLGQALNAILDEDNLTETNTIKNNSKDCLKEFLKKDAKVKNINMKNQRFAL